ncbi:MAG: hypothetical protein ACOYL6_05640 [Bacteriovoracaceae bacterium]
MKKTLLVLFYLSTFIPISEAATLSLKQLLAIKPEASSKGLPISGMSRDFSYEIEFVGGKVVTVQINFNSPVPHENYFKKNIDGFCLVQGLGGDDKINRYFFFNKDGNRRYEVLANQKIKSILIKDIPGAKLNKSCQFSELIQLGNVVEKVQGEK